MAEKPGGLERVKAAAAGLGLDVAIVEMPATTRTAEEAAAACGCVVGQIVKSLVFAGAESGRPYLILVSGANRVDEVHVAAAIGEPVRRPDAAYVRERTGFAIGGVAPIGHAEPVATFMDRDLFGHNVVWAAAGTPRAVFAVAPDRLRAATGATVVTVTA